MKIPDHAAYTADNGAPSMTSAASKAGGILKKLVILSLLTAISIILERLLGYNDKLISVSFSYLPVALAGMLFGPIPGAIVCAGADFLGALLFPVGPLDLRFTLIAAVKGGLYGLLLHQAKPSRTHAIIAQVLVTLIAHLTLNTLVISTIVGKGFFALLPLRLVKNVLFFPVELITLMKIIEYKTSFERLAR